MPMRYVLGGATLGEVACRSAILRCRPSWSRAPREDLPGRHPDVWKAAQRARAGALAALLKRADWNLASEAPLHFSLMRRRWGLASFLCLVLAASGWRPRSRQTSTATRRPTPERRAGAPRRRSSTARCRAACMRRPPRRCRRAPIEVSTLSGFGRRTGLLGAEHKFNRAIGDLAFAYGVTDMISIGLSLDGRYDKHWGLAPTRRRRLRRRSAPDRARREEHRAR